ncbi:hypothetical protein [Methylomarinum vadi]|uniref:hypothetical protein n=1 Tax=Methylomarinum vadi TaxID=438855 RepID=UPI0013630FF4|nr:hypothetical protein [Methylomarinum vadi]
METQLTVDNELLGADTELSPAAIDFLTASTEDNQSANIHRTGLDEYERAMVA